MLIEFSVGNYRSFKNIVTFSMVASKIKEKDQQLNEENVIQIRRNFQLLTSAAIYGANASGKSNLIKALDFMQNMVTNSSKGTQAGEPINVEPFRLGHDTDKKPSHFEIVFTSQGTQYRYGFKATQKRVIAEWLYHVPTVQETLLFERKYDRFAMSSRFKEGKGWENKTRPNTLFLSLIAQFNGMISTAVLESVNGIAIVPGLDDREGRLLTSLLFHTIGKEGIVDFIRNLDLDISDIEIAQLKKIESEQSFDDWLPAIQVSHHLPKTKNSEPHIIKFDLQKNESEGTKKLVHLSGYLWSALNFGRVLIIDEMDARLHPIITREIIKLFNSKKTNPKSAQLIIVTHDTNLLEQKIFRRDQIWFTEKNREGATDLYSLVEYKTKSGKVRNDAPLERDYIRGRYGAIPFIGDLSIVRKK